MNRPARATLGLTLISLMALAAAGGCASTAATLLLAGERHLHLPQATLTANGHGDAIEITTDTFARQVTLEMLEGDANVTGAVFEDNFFDMVPGERRVVAIRYAAGGNAVRVQALNAKPQTAQRN